MSECPASDRIAIDPVANPTIALAIVNPAEAKIEDSATCSFSFCIERGSAKSRTKLEAQRQCSERYCPPIRRSRARHRIENLDIGEQLLGRKSIGRAAFDRIGPGLEIHAYSIGVLVVSRSSGTARTTVDETRRDTLVDIAPFLCFDPALVANESKTAIERRRGQARDAPTGAVLEVDFGTHEVFRRRRKNL